MTRKSGKHSVWHTEPLDNFFDLIRSHQQRISRSPPLAIEPATTEPKLYRWPLIHIAQRQYGLRSLVRSPEMEITVYAAQCSVCHTECLPNFLVMVIQFIMYNSSLKKKNIYIYIYNAVLITRGFLTLSLSLSLSLSLFLSLSLSRSLSLSYIRTYHLSLSSIAPERSSR